MSERYLVQADDGTLRAYEVGDDGGSSWRQIRAPDWEALQGQGYEPADFSELSQRLEGQAQSTRDRWARDAKMRAEQEAMVEALRARGMLPEQRQGGPRLRRTGQQTEDGKDLFEGYLLDMRGTEHKGPLSIEEANYLYNLDPERAEVVGPEEDLVPLPQPQPAPEQRSAMLQAMRRK